MFLNLFCYDFFREAIYYLLLSAILVCSCKTEEGDHSFTSDLSDNQYGLIHNDIVNSYLSFSTVKSNPGLEMTKEEFAKLFISFLQESELKHNFEITSFSENDINSFCDNLSVIMDFENNDVGLITYYVNSAPVSNEFKNKLNLFFDSCLLNINLNPACFSNFVFPEDCKSVDNEYDLFAQRLVRSIGYCSYMLWNLQGTTKVSDNTAYSTLVDVAVGVGTCGLGLIGIALSAAASLAASGVDLDKAVKDTAESQTD